MDEVLYNSIPATFELLEEIKEDTRFTPVKVWVAHTGKNLNKSFFTKELLEKMIPSLAYVPIVGFIQSDNTNKDDFLGHEERYVVTVDGVETEYMGRMYGFIPSEHNARFENKTVNGVVREYLVADGIISNKFSKSKEIFDRDNAKGQSMELERETIAGYFDKDNDQFMFTDARFDALCILGDSRIPAMVGGSVEKIQFSALKVQLAEMVEELKLEFEIKKGGDRLDMLKELEGIIENYSHVTTEFIEDIKTKIDTFETIENLQEALQDEESKQFALTVRKQLDFLQSSVGELEVHTNRWGETESRFGFMDVNFETMEVYAMDYQNWKDVGFTFTKDGEMFVIDKDSMFLVAWQPMKLTDDASSNFSMAEKVNDVNEYSVTKADEKIEAVKTEYDEKIETQKVEFETEIERLNSEIEEFKTYKYEVEKSAKKDYISAVENISDDEKSDLVEKIDEFSIEALTDEVAKIIGKKAIKFSTGIKVVDNISTNFDYDKKPTRAYYDLMNTTKK